MLETREDHARNPEEDDVVARDERIRRVEILELRRLFRPAERGERPERGGKPRVERVLVALQMRAAALRADLRLRFRNDRLAAVAVPRGNLVAPPELTGNAPVLDVLHPIIVDFIHAVRDEADLAVFHDIHRRFRKRLHFHEPLRRNARLDDCTAAITGADVVLDRLNLDEVAARIEILHDLLSRLQCRHARVFASVFVDDAAVVHDVDDRQLVAQADLKVVRVVRRRDLHNAGAEILLDIRIRDNRDFPIDERQDHRLANQRLIALVVRVHRHGGIAEHRLRTRCGQLNIARTIRKRIAQVPERAFLFLKLDLRIGNRGLAVRAPVDDALAAVDQPLVVQLLEHVVDSLVAALVHREAQAVPVAG